MVPFNVKVGGQKVGITWPSLFWFFAVTAAATIVGELVYQKWVSPYLAALPNLPALPPAQSNVVSVQNPSQSVGHYGT